MVSTDVPVYNLNKHNEFRKIYQEYQVMTKQKPTFEIDPDKPFFIFDSSGDWHATIINGCLWDLQGDYIGFIRGAHHDVYTSSGRWIGNVRKDGRIVRRRANTTQPTLQIKRLKPRGKPANLPPRAPLPTLHSDLDYSLIDVLEWDPDIFKD